MPLLFLLAACCDPASTTDTAPPPADTADTADTTAVPCTGESTYAGPPTDDWLFGESGNLTLNDFSLELPPENHAVLAQLETGSKTMVCGTLVTPYGVLANVGVRLVGKAHNSFQPIDSKPYLDISTDAFVEGQTLSGLRRLRLYNQWEDQSGLQRYIGYQMWRDAGYPAPRAGLATLTLNGRALGTYGTGECVDGAFLARWPDVFGSAEGDIFEGEYGNDFTDPLPEFDIVQGDDVSPDFEALAATVRESLDLEAELGPYMDPVAWHRHWALEMAVGASEGYTEIANNWYLAQDTTSGRFTMLPWGFDKVLRDLSVLPESPRALLPVRGGAQASFFAGQCAALLDVVEAVDWEGLAADVDALDRVTPASDVIDGTDRYTATEIEQGRDAVRFFLATRPGQLLTWHAENCVPG